MAKSIVRESPALDNEDHDGYEVWYTPGSGKHDATGFLENRIRNIRRRDPETVKAPEKEPSTTKSRLISTINLDLSTDELQEADLAAMITWLKHHQAPEDQVKDMMRKTCKHRIAKIRTEKEKPIRQLLDDYPHMLNTEGMIEQDFRILFEEVADALYLKWEKVYRNIILYADKQASWRDMLHFHGKLETEEEEANIAFQLLPLLFPTGMKFKEGKKGPSQHATTGEALKTFIQVEKIGTNMTTFLEEVRQTQPFILALGERKLPEQVFVVIERKTVACSSILQAVDVCFKLFYIFDLEYPWECNNTWDFLQKFIFGLGEGKGKGKSTSAVFLLSNYLKKDIA